MASTRLDPSDYSIFEVQIKAGADRPVTAGRSPDKVRAMYYAVQENGWVTFKDHQHKAVRDYSPGTVLSVSRAPVPGDAFAFDATTPVDQVASDLAHVWSEERRANLARRIDRQITFAVQGREREDHLRAVAALHPDWSVEQVYEAAERCPDA